MIIVIIMSLEEMSLETTLSKRSNPLNPIFRFMIAKNRKKY